uniref:glutaminase n=2 Tax=Tetraodon nigroviridis TaxID=99883 RepID=H3DE52_TETNG
NSDILPSLEDLLFYTVAEGEEKIPVHKFLTALKATGLSTADPRLKECMETLQEVKNTEDGLTLDRDLFKKCVQSNIVLLTQAFRKKFVIPDFQAFTSHIDDLYQSSRALSGGQVADYIPQLAKFSPELWAVSLCTVDGQRHTIGDSKVPFCLQSCVKPLKYAIAVNDHGTEYVHSFIGKEPSGLRFNKLFLNEEGEPPCLWVSQAYIYVNFYCVLNKPRQLKGRFLQFLSLSFSSAVLKVADVHSKVHLKPPLKLKGKGFTRLYYQQRRFKIKEEQRHLSFVIYEMNGERVLSPEAVRNTLSLMHSCGMYDFSGQFAFHVGLPAKSGVSGGILLVVPNVMGVMCWSPPLDKLGNSVRGIRFCTDLVELFNFHNYDNLRHFAKKYDPRREGGEQRVKSVINLLFAAYTGDITALRRLALSSMDMEQKDYDSRTALHVAAAEGHAEAVRFLLEACRVNPVPKDRWGKTPLDEAMHFCHHDVADILRRGQETY